ncbi:MAG: hypothetical protein OEV94_08665 [Deltaproteobacteria bacterium]|nr:hypothetical protein [Deltaproteobacteria bacterium]
MRKLIVGLVAILSLTGMALTGSGESWGFGSGFSEQGSKAASLGHIWLGLLFTLLFPLYLADHLKKNRAWLRRFCWLTGSGLTQLAAGSLLVLTGLGLLLYGQAAWEALREAHEWLTWPMAGAMTLHFLSPKTWKKSP